VEARGRPRRAAQAQRRRATSIGARLTPHSVSAWVSPALTHAQRDHRLKYHPLTGTGTGTYGTGTGTGTGTGILITITIPSLHRPH